MNLQEINFEDINLTELRQSLVAGFGNELSGSIRTKFLDHVDG
jgi:hypothetical protein